MDESLSFDLKGKMVLVTGGGRGIGRAIALACARQGADIGVGSRQVEQSEQVAQLCRQEGGRAAAWPLDVARLDSLRAFVDAALREFGRIDMLVNNVGLTIVKPAWELSEAEYDAVQEVNLKAPFFASTWAARSMVDRGIHGAIINISSQVGHVGGALRANLLGRQGRPQPADPVAGCRMGPVRDPRVRRVADLYAHRTAGTRRAEPRVSQELREDSAGSSAEPEEVAAAVVYLASEAGRFVTGHTLLLDGGFTAV